MPAIHAVEPNNSSGDGAEFLVIGVLERGLSIREAWRQATAAGVFSGSYDAAQKLVREARAREAEGETAQTVAGRMLAVLSAELSALERSKAPKDLERLERLARTLGTIARLSPQKRKSEAQTGLASLIQEETSDETRGSDVDGSSDAS